MSDTLSHVRRVNRFLASQARKKLKKKMNPYNRLSNDNNLPHEYDTENAKTTQDVIHETLELARSVNKSLRSRMSHSDKTDKLLREASVVQPEVREAWHAKINMSATLSEDAKLQLRTMCNNPRVNTEPEYLRNMRLNNLARAWVNAWLMAKLDLVNQDRIPE